jgi:hypothetical protein
LKICSLPTIDYFSKNTKGTQKQANITHGENSMSVAGQKKEKREGKKKKRRAAS